jgi:hypothetical protein
MPSVLNKHRLGMGFQKSSDAQANMASISRASVFWLEN